MKQTEVIVIGGGLAGVAAATILARAGRAVVLLEQEQAARHKVCGEFLSAEALQLLGQLGFTEERLKEAGATAIQRVQLCGAASRAATTLPFSAVSLTRRCLDGLLLDAAEQAGVVVRRGTRVESLERANKHWQARLSTGEMLQAARAVLASGKHDLRGFPRPAGAQNDLVALKMYWRLAPAQTAELQGAVELLLHPRGYTGLQLVEGDTANLCCLLERGHLTQIGGWPGLLKELRAACPQAGTRLADAEPLLERPLAVASLPYGFVCGRALGEQLWAVGDQAAVIPSFTGDGMSIALYSGIAAAQSLLSGQTSDAFQRALQQRLEGQVRRATLLSRALVQSWGQSALLFAARLSPIFAPQLGSSLLQAIARTTRIPAKALQELEGWSGDDAASLCA